MKDCDDDNKGIGDHSNKEKISNSACGPPHSHNEYSIVHSKITSCEYKKEDLEGIDNHDVLSVLQINYMFQFVSKDYSTFSFRDEIETKKEDLRQMVG